MPTYEEILRLQSLGRWPAFEPDAGPLHAVPASVKKSRRDANKRARAARRTNRRN